MTFVPSRRQHARYTCQLPFKAIGTGAREMLEGAVLNIGMGGAYIRVKGTLKLKTVTLRVALGAETMSMEARVVRTGGIDASDKASTLYGLEFLKDSTNQGRLRLVVDRVRANTNLGMPTMRNYWR